MRGIVLSIGFVFIVLYSFSAAFAQSTFRGGIAGIVADPQGANIPNVDIVATDLSTGVVYKTASSSAGAYSIQDLPLGDYSVVASYTGFSTIKINEVRVSAGTIFSLPITLQLATASTTIEVSAAALSLDTTTQVRTFTLPKEEVTDVPINGRSYTQMTNMLPGNTTGTTRFVIDGVDNNDIESNSASSNQGGVDGIPGTLLPLDSIEEYSAEQQTGVESGGYSGYTINLGIKSGTDHIHGTVYYFNRNEFFAAMGPFTKYSNAQLSARGLPLPKKPPIHFQEYGGSIGGPIWKEKAFYFINYERQQYVLGQGTSSQTEPSQAYIDQTLALLSQGGVTPATNPSINMGINLIKTLWQPEMLTGDATPGNWTPPTSAAQHGYSNNLMSKFDQTINSKMRLSERWFYGMGVQTAPLSTSQNPWYYQVAGERVDNFAVTLNNDFSPKLTNQVLMGVNLFMQPFSDVRPNGGAAATGFIVGVGPGNTFGQPGIQISGFDGTGGTSYQSRRDLTGHLTETLTLLLGKHNIRAGAEYRRYQVYAQATGRGSSSIYTRGNFNYSGSRGYNAPSGGNGTPYAASVAPEIKALADFLQGEAGSATLYNGNLDRNVSENGINLYVQDSFQITPSLNINYGLRWDYLSPVGDDQQDLSVFRAGSPASSLSPTGGLAVVGHDISEPYKASSLQIAPRVGFSWQPGFLHGVTKGMVIRAAIGLYFDTPGLGTWLYPGSLPGNPAGTRPLYNEQLTSPDIQPNVSIFPQNAASSIPNNGAGGQCIGIKVATCPALNIAAVDPNFTTGNTTNISASVQKSLGSQAVMEISYVGSRGRHLSNSIDLNQTTYGATTNQTVSNGFLYAQLQRPYFGPYPNFGTITQTSSFGSSNANALQAYVRTRNWHGLISEVSYALSTASGTGSIQDYNQPSLDSGSSLVITNQIKGYWTYIIPDLKHGPSWLVNKWITGGWQTAGAFSFHGAPAITATASAACNNAAVTDSQGNVIGHNTYALTCSGLGLGEAGARANLTGHPLFCPSGNCGGSAISNTSTSKINSGYVQWFNPYAVIAPPGCSVGAASVGPDCSLPLATYHGSTAPGQIHGGPGYGDIDLSIFKNFPITEKIKAQLRGEMYNFLNRVNYKAPTLAASNTAADLRYNGLNSGTSTGRVTTTVGGTSDPGITPGEPFNVQLGLKLIF